MSRSFFKGAQWAPKDIARMVGNPSLAINQITGIVDQNIGVTSDEGRVFNDKSGGFTFDMPMWKNMWVADRARYTPDAIAHRDEAARRKIVCRLEARDKETAHWLAQQRFLENLFKLEPLV